MITERANAKINVYLSVTGRRENGYHEIVSVMQTVSLCDLVTVSFLPGSSTQISLSVSGNEGVPANCRNLAWRAAEHFLSHVERSGSVEIYLEKHIPMAAGLAGGSSDAAAVFRALNRLCGMPLSEEELCALGATLGADIPFCIRGGASLVEGIGERLSDFPRMPECHLVVACRGEGVSTPWAYGQLDLRYDGFAGEAREDCVTPLIRAAWEAGDAAGSAGHFFNLFEEVVPGERPDVVLLRDTMRASGAICAMMSGSGPSVFGLFPTQEEASDACLALREMGAAAFVCHPTEKHAF